MTQLVGIALGRYERLQGADAITRTSLVYWWRRSRGALLATYRELKDWVQIVTKWRAG